jgi:HD-GYP domain-containing protein (c-di-GMP phosphodiesterase class II)
LVVKADKLGFLQDNIFAEIQALGAKKMTGINGEEPCLTAHELECLSVRKGTLTDGERAEMEGHVIMTRRMLTEMDFPKDFKSVPDWAASHHEHINGKGYPNKLAGEDIPPDVRIISILDIYDALTAVDRPYKPAMPPEKAFAILDDMAKYGQIDADILQHFKNSEAWNNTTD